MTRIAAHGRHRPRYAVATGPGLPGIRAMRALRLLAALTTWAAGLAVVVGAVIFVATATAPPQAARAGYSGHTPRPVTHPQAAVPLAGHLHSRRHR
jgi:hypothetical protein